MNHNIQQLQFEEYQFELPTDSITRNILYHERYRIFCKKMSVFNVAQFPSNKEQDEYDDTAQPAIIRFNDEIIAHTRIILPTKHFPIEDHCSLPNYFNRATTIETSRTFVSQDWKQSNAVWLLCHAVYAYCQQKKYTHILSFSNAVMYNGFKKRGVDFNYVGNSIEFFGHKSYPLIINVHQDMIPAFY